MTRDVGPIQGALAGPRCLHAADHPPRGTDGCSLGLTHPRLSSRARFVTEMQLRGTLLKVH
jgi:hypothetical protein